LIIKTQKAGALQQVTPALFWDKSQSRSIPTNQFLHQ